MRLVLAFCIAAVGMSLHAGTAAADAGRKFQRAFRAGVTAYEHGKYDAAKRSFEKARQLRPTAVGPERYLALVAQAQKRFRACVDHARRAVINNPTGSRATAMRTLHESCRRSWGRPKFDGPYGDDGALSIESDLDNSTVFIDGLKEGVTPLLPRRLPVGKHTVSIDRAGYLPKKGTVTIVPGLVLDVRVVLKRDPNARPPAPLVTVSVTAAASRRSQPPRWLFGEE